MAQTKPIPSVRLIVGIVAFAAVLVIMAISLIRRAEAWTEHSAQPIEWRFLLIVGATGILISRLRDKASAREARVLAAVRSYAAGRVGGIPRVYTMVHFGTAAAWAIGVTLTHHYHFASTMEFLALMGLVNIVIGFDDQSFCGQSVAALSSIWFLASFALPSQIGPWTWLLAPLIVAYLIGCELYRAREFARRLAAGYRLHIAGLHEAAELSVRMALAQQKDPKPAADTLTLLASIYRVQGRREEAVRCMGVALELAPDRAGAAELVRLS